MNGTDWIDGFVAELAEGVSEASRRDGNVVQPDCARLNMYYQMRIAGALERIAERLDARAAARLRTDHRTPGAKATRNQGTETARVRPTSGKVRKREVKK
ncbi:MAG TPA: hypothetical protein VGL22_13340 [Terracidiphilus sp.]